MSHNLTEIYVVEYSIQQNSFHVRTVGEMLKINHHNLLKRISADFVPIIFTETRKQADHFVKAFSGIIDKQVTTEQELSKEIDLALSYSDWDIENLK